MAQKLLARALLVADLANEPGLDPDVAGAAWRRAFAGRLGADERREAIERVDQLAIAEAATDPAGVDEDVSVVRRYVERAERRPPALRLRVAHDDEIIRSVRPDLPPLRGTTPAIRRVGPLADDALEVHPLDLGKQSFALLLEVLGAANGPRLRHQLLEDRLALDERQRAQVVVLEAQNVEGVVGRG